jgi:hypothetical protein
MMSALSTMSWTFTMMMKCWWSYFSDFDMCWRQHCLQCHGHSPWNVGWSYFSDFDVCWCQHCLQCHGLSPWNVGGHTSVTLTCEDVSIVYNVMDIHHEMLVVILQWLWRVMMSALSTMSWTFTMKCWWSYFSDFDVCWSVLSTMWRTFTMKCWWSYFSDLDVCWCRYCSQGN